MVLDMVPLRFFLQLAPVPCPLLLQCSRDFTRIDTAVIASLAIILKEDVAAMSVSLIGSVPGTWLPVHCVCFSCCCCCYRLLCSSCPTHVPLNTLSARTGFLNLRCFTSGLVSQHCSCVRRALPVRVHPTRAIQRCPECFSAMRLSFSGTMLAGTITIQIPGGSNLQL